MTNESRFNDEAASWDSNPFIHAATANAKTAILSRLDPSAGAPDILDLGCGTGLLSLALSPTARSITSIDVAQGMVDVFNSKLEAPDAPTNIRAACVLLEDPDDPVLKTDPATGSEAEQARRFDLVVSHLVLHHIPDLAPFLKTIHGVLKPGGQAMLTDFEDFGPEARLFHPESKMDGVERHGIKRAEIEQLFKSAGFEHVKVETAFEMEKAIESEPRKGDSGKLMTFPFLICQGRK
ncbi:S-adenosyl-L-methionine-dependent methyltransferase [Cladorrhinum samala]|uniref:S-adenosyl-L-methionine-dependent methyltransferase n=1 Tax=Cladorrhinum samala TaxID=585594 RepID=A0AAV9HKP8_9PEZI|nr:S-adenosyl-L-methionine-dependent methyltransferase [Cladorrhinum samala]